MKPLMIGLTGARNVGKSTVANLIVREFGFSRVHAFDGGKAATYAYFTHVGVPKSTADRMVYGDLKDTPSDYLPGTSTPRFFMEKFGRFMGETMGVEWTLGAEVESHYRAQPHARLIAESLVYEAAWFRSKGGVIIRVERPGHAGPAGCESDAFQASIEADHTLINDSDLIGLASRTRELVKSLTR